MHVSISSFAAHTSVSRSLSFAFREFRYVRHKKGFNRCLSLIKKVITWLQLSTLDEIDFVFDNIVSTASPTGKRSSSFKSRVKGMSIAELGATLKQGQVDISTCIERQDLEDKMAENQAKIEVRVLCLPALFKFSTQFGLVDS